ncbi:MFS general substrate transporter [Marasmius fiardii PR-910]|nr:MFS general substrate transporter [Marasmius fiardii PR-910]
MAYRDWHKHHNVKGSAENPPKPPSTFHSCMIVAACALSNLVNTLNMTGPSISLPAVQREFQSPQADLGWVVSAYPLSSGCLLLLVGRLADLYGRKKAFELGLLWLFAFTLACGFVNDPLTLSVLRGLQGCGAAATIPAALGIMANVFPPSKARSLAFAVFAGASPIGGCFGMALGGAMTQLTPVTWRSIYYFSAAITGVSFILGYCCIDPDVSDCEDKRVDWIGGLLSVSGLVLIVFVLGQGESAPNTWANPYIITLLILGVILTTLYVLWQRFLESVHDGKTVSPYAWLPTPPPLMRVSLWTRSKGQVGVTFVIALLDYACFMGWSLWILLYYQNYSGLTPILTMVRLVPMFIVGFAGNLLIAGVVGRLSLVTLMALGGVVTAGAPLLFALINPATTYWAFGFPSTILAVLGSDFVFPTGTIFVAKVALPSEQSVAGAVFQGMTQLGTTLGVSISTIAYNRVLLKQATDLGLTPNDIPQTERLSAHQAAMWVNFGFGIAAAVLALLFLRGVGPVGAKPCHNHHRHHFHIPGWHLPHFKHHNRSDSTIVGDLVQEGPRDVLEKATDNRKDKGDGGTTVVVQDVRE